jgi:hypothetical protein
MSYNEGFMWKFDIYIRVWVAEVISISTPWPIFSLNFTFEEFIFMLMSYEFLKFVKVKSTNSSHDSTFESVGNPRKNLRIFQLPDRRALSRILTVNKNISGQ